MGSCVCVCVVGVGACVVGVGVCVGMGVCVCGVGYVCGGRGSGVSVVGVGYYSKKLYEIPLVLKQPRISHVQRKPVKTNYCKWK